MTASIRFIAPIVCVVLVIATADSFAHPGHSHRKSSRTSPPGTESSADAVKVVELDLADASDDAMADDNLMPLDLLLAQVENQAKGDNVRREQTPGIAKSFEAFVKLNSISTRQDDRYFFVESNGIPDHRMMVGITAWQQQVPIPQKYFGDNAWQIPLHPVPAKKPMSAKTNFFRGAIALAVNGVPIFNPIKNDGRTDTLVAGELDEFGGHCGRADDYHYHIAPVHLEKVVGKGQPIAYALDGYPIYGYEEPDGSAVVGLDAFNGHKDKAGNYHYHATQKYPYLNGGFFGEVIERDGQVDPQPRAEPLRPALPPMKGAKIVDFKEAKPGSYLLTYDIRGKKGTVAYSLAADGSANFSFTDTSGKTTNEAYLAKRRGPGGGGNKGQPPPRKGDNPQPRDDKRPPRGENPPPRNEDRPTTSTAREDSSKPQSHVPQLTVTSSSVDTKGFISIDCTCDGAGQSPAVEWKDAPKGTKSFAVSLWHTAPDQEKSYWLVYDIPANVTKLAKNSKGVGKLSLNDKRRAEYDPMCSKGPGVKEYHITVFALSAEPKLDPNKANRAGLLEAIKDITLAEGTLDFRYERR